MVIPVKSTPIADDRSASSVRVLVVEDFEPFQRVSRSMLQGRPELQVICEVSDGLEAVQKGRTATGLDCAGHRAANTRRICGRSTNSQACPRIQNNLRER